MGKFSYQMMVPGKVQISGFCDIDNYTDVITKVARGLNISANPESLKLLVCGGWLPIAHYKMERSGH